MPGLLRLDRGTLAAEIARLYPDRLDRALAVLPLLRRRPAEEVADVIDVLTLLVDSRGTDGQSAKLDGLLGRAPTGGAPAAPSGAVRKPSPDGCEQRRARILVDLKASGMTHAAYAATLGISLRALRHRIYDNTERERLRLRKRDAARSARRREQR